MVDAAELILQSSTQTIWSSLLKYSMLWSLVRGPNTKKTEADNLGFVLPQELNKSGNWAYNIYTTRSPAPETKLDFENIQAVIFVFPYIELRMRI